MDEKNSDSGKKHINYSSLYTVCEECGKAKDQCLCCFDESDDGYSEEEI